MLRDFDTQLAVERAAMPEYALAQPPLSPAALKALQGCLLALWQLLRLPRSWLSILLRLLEALLGAPPDRQEGQAQLAKERVEVLLPPPPTISGFLTAFRDDNVSIFFAWFYKLDMHWSNCGMVLIYNRIEISSTFLHITMDPS